MRLLLLANLVNQHTVPLHCLALREQLRTLLVIHINELNDYLQ